MAHHFPLLFFPFCLLQLLFSQSKVSLSLSLSPLLHLGLWPQIYNSPTFSKRTISFHLSSNRTPQSAIKPHQALRNHNQDLFPPRQKAEASHCTTLSNPIAQPHPSIHPIPSLARPSSPPPNPATDPHPFIHPSQAAPNHLEPPAMTIPQRGRRTSYHIISYHTAPLSDLCAPSHSHAIAFPPTPHLPTLSRTYNTYYTTAEYTPNIRLLKKSYDMMSLATPRPLLAHL